MLNLKEDSEAIHLRLMAKQFEANLEEGMDASTITMTNNKAKGFISTYRLFNGLSVWVYNVTFGSKFKVELKLSPEGPIYFCYNIKGHFFHRFGDHEEFAKVLQNQNMIVKGSPNNTVEITFPEKIKLEIVVIMVDIKSLRIHDIRSAKRMSERFQSIFDKIPQNQPYRYLGNIDVETKKYASIISANNNTDLVGSLLAEGAVLNMLASQVDAYEKATTETLPLSILSKSDLSKISSLGAYVIENLNSEITIFKLSQQFRLSPKKLQVGIKHLYGDTLGHYILNLRMGHAKNLFETTEMNVSEISDLVGIFSHGYFSKLFKKRYGVSPSKFRNV